MERHLEGVNCFLFEPRQTVKSTSTCVQSWNKQLAQYLPWCTSILLGGRSMWLECMRKLNFPLYFIPHANWRIYLETTSFSEHAQISNQGYVTFTTLYQFKRWLFPQYCMFCFIIAFLLSTLPLPYIIWNVALIERFLIAIITTGARLSKEVASSCF